MFHLFFIFILLSATVQAQSLNNINAARVLNVTSCEDVCLTPNVAFAITAAGKCFVQAYPGANSQTPVTPQSILEVFVCTCPLFQLYASNSTCLTCINKYTPQFTTVINDCNSQNYNGIVKIYDPSLSSNSVKLGAVSAITIGLLSISLIIGWGLF